MRRHESIAALSRDHHFGLLFCWKIRQGIKKQVPAERIKPYVKYFWSNHLQQHFEEEETLLFTALQDNLVAQAISEHEHIKQLIEVITGAGSFQPDQFRALADALDKHIRFEERILFPYIEETLSAEKLTRLGKRLQQIHQTGEKDDYPDEFWV
ncbi:MAG TPA: hemerythrin domain-containing protein [Chitinophagaceae bacterium]|nr:hemerythrin domain-containing protein [Chitinophagaceae bacterium]